MSDMAEPGAPGLASLHSRVESWECDFNDHWNARFHVRAFQLAAETLPHLPGLAELPPGPALTRTLRFHRELFAGAAVEIRSARIAGGPFAGALVHLLSSGGRLASTALDTGGMQVSGLPEVPGERVRLAHPRALAGPFAEVPDGAETSISETGPVRPADLDHRGALLAEDIIRRTSLATHRHVAALGLTERYTEETGISRMAVESRFRILGDAPAGIPLRVRTRIAHRGVKSFRVAHGLETHAGSPLAAVEHNLVTVDLRTRKAVPLPDFLRAG